MKLYTEADLKKVISIYSEEYKTSTDEILKELNLTPIELPSNEEIEEKLNVAYGNGYEQGEMDFYKKMQMEGNQYADGYAEGYQRALELVKFQIVERLEQGGNK
jgi:hypothetical protein